MSINMTPPCGQTAIETYSPDCPFVVKDNKLYYRGKHVESLPECCRDCFKEHYDNKRTADSQGS